jgi:preprotein translocase subunit YajC
MTLVELLPFAAIAAAFWLLIIRPSSTRRKAQAALVASLAPGQRIMTTAGVFGTIVSIDADRVSVEISPGVVIEMLAAAIAQVVPAPVDIDPAPALSDTETQDAAAGGEDGVDGVVAGPALEADRG